MQRSLLIQAILGLPLDPLFRLFGLLLGLEPVLRVRVAEAVHVHGLDADSRAVVVSLCGAHALACVFFALAPLVQGEVLATHIEIFVSCDLSFEVESW